MKKQTELKTESPKKTIFFLLWCFFSRFCICSRWINMRRSMDFNWMAWQKIDFFFAPEKTMVFFVLQIYTSFCVCVCVLVWINLIHSFPSASRRSLSLVLMFFHQTISYFIVFIASNTFCSAWNKIYKWFLFPSTLPSMPSHSWHPSHFFARSLARLRSLCVFRWLHWRDASIS